MTGILLLVEMTGSFDHLLPLAFVSLIAYVVADLLKAEPIYDLLLEKMLKEKEIEIDDSDKQMMFETIVQFDSIADRKKLSEINLPEGCLLVSVHRSGKDIIPHGDTELQAGDYLTFLIKREDEVLAREQLRLVLNEK